METKKLNHFLTVYNTQNLRQAAEILNMSHSALSKSLKTLEEELKSELFIPEGRGIASTKEADRLYPKAKKIVEEISQLTRDDVLTSHQKLRVSTFEVFSTYFLQLLHPELQDYQLELHEEVQGNIEVSVAESRTDIGITYDPIPTRGVEFLKITEMKVSPFVRNGSFKNLKTIEIPFAAPLRPIIGSPTGIKGLDGWPEHKFPRQVQYQVVMLESALELARQGKCAVFIPNFLAELHNQVCKKEFHLQELDYPNGMKKVRRSIYLVKRKNAIESKEMKKVAKAIRRLG